MFEVDPERTWVDPSAGSISTLVQSLNTPLVAAGPHPAEQVQSFIVTRQAPGGGAFEIFVFFHLTESNQAVLYRWDGGPVPPPQLQYVQDEALSFCESMGFMMDNLTVPGLNTPDQRSTFLGNLAPFVEDLSTIVREPSADEEASAVKKTVDPLAEFQKARAALQESGQATTRDFVAAQPHEDPPLVQGGFDASAVGTIPGGDGEMQIEITEIEGLELIPDGAAPLADAPLVRGQHAELDEENAKTGIFDPPGPAGGDDEPPLVVGTHAPKAGHAEALRQEREIDLDSMLADMPESANGATNGGGDDLSSELDSILDGVESSRSGKKGAPAKPAAPAKSQSRPIPKAAPSKPIAAAPSKPMAAPPPKPSAPPPPPPDDIDLDIDISMEPGSAADALEALGDGDEPPMLDTAPGGPSQSLDLSSLLGETPAPLPPVAKPAAVAPATPPAVRPSVEAAWESSYHAPPLKPANGNGTTRLGQNGGAPLDIATDDLARLLAML